MKYDVTVLLTKTSHIQLCVFSAGYMLFHMKHPQPFTQQQNNNNKNRPEGSHGMAWFDGLPQKWGSRGTTQQTRTASMY